MFQYFLFLLIIVAVHGSGEFMVTHSPSSIQFSKDHEVVDESLLKDVYLVSLGFTTHKESDWKGLQVTNPFHYPEAVASVVVEGLSSLDYPSGYRFPLKINENDEAVWRSLSHRVSERYPDEQAVLLMADLSEGKSSLKDHHKVFKNIDVDITRFNVKHLDTNNTEDLEFLKELALLSEVSHKAHLSAVSNDGVPDIYYFIFRGLRAVRELHGVNSAADREARHLLKLAIEDFTKTFRHAYKGKVLVTVMSVDGNAARRTRSLLADPEPAPDSRGTMNLSKEYDPNYPVIFNILLWFNIAFFYSIIAVAVFIATMDPGRDSIIYRMTSTRMKKDN